MWCAKCQADVAAEVSADHRQIRCATCGEDISLAQSARTVPRTKEARDLLERWSRTSLLEPQSSEQAPPKPRPEMTLEQSMAADVVQPVEASPNNPFIRLDRKPIAATRNRPARAQTRRRPEPSERIEHPHDENEVYQQRVDDPHEAIGHVPHFDVQVAVAAQQRRGGSWVALAGQLLAYGGVGLLTIGTSMILWGYFGGLDRYAPTGWLIATAGQMLLFLGVVTLVSGGMEQTAEEVRSQIALIGEKLVRIERASRDRGIRGPHTPVENFADSDRRYSAEESTYRSQVSARR